MEPMDQERELDRWLDTALTTRGRIEPRAGLEKRVLARLSAESHFAKPHWLRWGWILFATATTLWLVVWLAWTQLSIPVAPVAKSLPSPANASGTAPAARLSGVQATHPRNLADVRRLNAKSGAGASQRISPARSETFPSPCPLSEQEELLARYVRDFPERAVQVARAQTELRKQDEREMALPRPDTASTDLDQ